jgi:cysteine desulfurase
MPSRVYLDHNAASPIREVARVAVDAALGIGANPSSVHSEGRAARGLIEQARAQVAALAEISPEAVVFTSGATEANNLALKGTDAGRVLVSAVEHVSVLDVVPDAERIAVDGNGVVDLAALKHMLGADSRKALVSVMAANNETGVIQLIAEIARIVHDAGAILHCDAAQAPGRLPLAEIAAAADLVSLSSPKIGGPFGAGALLVREGLDLVPLLLGGGQEQRLRSGTENLSGIAGFGAAAQAALGDFSHIVHINNLHDRLESKVQALAPEAVIVGSPAPRLCNTTALALPGIPAESQIMALDLAGIAVGAGAACSSGKLSRSHVLEAMKLPDAIAASTIRISLSTTTTEADIDAFIAAWSALRTRALGNRAPGNLALETRAPRAQVA